MFSKSLPTFESQQTNSLSSVCRIATSNKPAPHQQNPGRKRMTHTSNKLHHDTLHPTQHCQHRIRIWRAFHLRGQKSCCTSQLEFQLQQNRSKCLGVGQQFFSPFYKPPIILASPHHPIFVISRDQTQWRWKGRLSMFDCWTWER